MEINGNGSMEVEYGKAALRARGIVVVIVLCTISMIAMLLYSTGRVETAVREHDRQMMDQGVQFRMAINRQSCITLFDFKDREYFRRKMLELKGAKDPFEELCPWIRN